MPHLLDQSCSQEELELLRFDYIVDLLPERGCRLWYLEKTIYPIQSGYIELFLWLS